MVLQVFNTLTRKKEKFVPRSGKKVQMFVCGITPYDYPHLGHAKTYVQFDVIAKYLRFSGFDVFYLQNITDIDDKIIHRAIKEYDAADPKNACKKLVDHYVSIYMENMKALEVTSINTYARATDYIPAIVSQVERLVKKGFAYKISDGYYFDVSKLTHYGALAKRTEKDDEDAVSRIDENTEKKNRADFCLWKFYKDGEPFWDTTLGKGRPGWHIEDTAITEETFGQQYDLHGGGRDLIFPHHEAEIAQMESISGKRPFVKYWMHSGFLNINKEKMSKSLGNFFTIQDALQHYSGKVLRYFFLQSHYRKPVDFSPENLDQAKQGLAKVYDFVRTLKHYSSLVKDYARFTAVLKKARTDFIAAMDDDFETSNALTVLFTLMKEVNPLLMEKKLSAKNVQTLLTFFEEMDAVFGILEQEQAIPKAIQILVEKREAARKNKQWKESDMLRDELKKKGYAVDDTPDGPVVRKL